ncbi:hypothetical protein BDC45DRAFT_571792 [Circinella umbellata]|nr:hypothetical protein BDC45DRAFT_571792 [Circinella umbellata]
MTNDNIVEPIQNQENPLEDVQVWSQRLIGKTIVFDNVAITEETFHKRDLPEVNRVLRPNDPATRDYRRERLNVITDDNYKVTSVYYG